MYIFFGALVFLVSIALHELGHAMKMKKHGIEIKEISLLGFGPRLFSFKWRKMFGEVPLSIRLIIIGAFVRPTEEGYDRILELPLRSR